MTIEFLCPACGKRFHAPEKFAGKKGRCKLCNEVIVVPLPTGHPGPKVPRSAGGGRKVGLWVGLAGGVGVLAAGGILWAVLAGSGGDPNPPGPGETDPKVGVNTQPPRQVVSSEKTGTRDSKTVPNPPDKVNPNPGRVSPAGSFQSHDSDFLGPLVHASGPFRENLTPSPKKDGTHVGIGTYETHKDPDGVADATFWIVTLYPSPGEAQKAYEKAAATARGNYASRAQSALGKEVRLQANKFEEGAEGALHQEAFTDTRAKETSAACSVSVLYRDVFLIRLGRVKTYDFSRGNKFSADQPLTDDFQAERAKILEKTRDLIDSRFPSR